MLKKLWTRFLIELRTGWPLTYADVYGQEWRKEREMRWRRACEIKPYDIGEIP